MAELTTGTGAGTQNTTQNPQTVPSGQTVGGASAQSGGVQPGTAQSLLTASTGLSLKPSALTTVRFDKSATGTQALSTSVTRPTPQHPINPVLFVISVVLVIAAAGLFWTIGRSAKSTTN